MPWIYENVFIHEDFIIKDEGINKEIALDLRLLNNDYVFSELKIQEMRLKDTMLSGDFIVKGRIIRDEDGKATAFSGKLFSRNITLDENPFLALRARFKITGDELEIESLRLGASYKLKGRLGLREPFKADFRLEIVRADMREIAIMVKAKNPDAVFGIMRGAFHIKGTLANLFSEGILESRGGRIGPIVYDLATARLEGFGPIVNIVDSSVKKDAGRLMMEGYIDLRNIAKGNLFEGLRVSSSDMKTIVWDGWDITKNGTDELSMKKAVSDDMRVGFKTMTRDSLPTYYDAESPEELSLEYRIGLQNLKMRLKEDEEFFGVEHKIKF